MRYTIEGFSQEYACSLRKEVDGKTIKLDCTDLVILRWFVDFYPKNDEGRNRRCPVRKEDKQHG